MYEILHWSACTKERGVLKLHLAWRRRDAQHKCDAARMNCKGHLTSIL